MRSRASPHRPQSHAASAHTSLANVARSLHPRWMLLKTASTTAEDTTRLTRLLG